MTRSGVSGLHRFFFNTGFLFVALTVLNLNFVDQARHKLIYTPVPASKVLGLKKFTPQPASILNFKRNIHIDFNNDYTRLNSYYQ